MSQDPRNNILNTKVSKDFRNRVLVEADKHLSQHRSARRKFFFSFIQNLGMASVAFWVGLSIFSNDEDEDEDELIMQALEENEELFLEVEQEDFELLLASENIEELDEVL